MFPLTRATLSGRTGSG